MSTPPSFRRPAAIGVLGLVFLIGLVVVGRGPAGSSPIHTDSVVWGANLGLRSVRVSDCGLLGPDPGSVNIPGPDYRTNVTLLWDKLCVLPTFMGLIERWDQRGANLSAGSGGFPGVAVYVSWGVNWAGPCDDPALAPPGGYCGHVEYWNGNVTSNELSGPFSENYGLGGTTECVPLTCHDTVTSGVSGPSLPADRILLAGSAIGAATVGYVTLLRRAGIPPRRAV